MKTIKLRTNIGTADNRSLQLPSVTEGSIVEVTDDTATHMLKRGWAEIVDDGDGLAELHDEPSGEDDTTESSAPVDLKAVPPVEIQADEGDDEPGPESEGVEDDGPDAGDDASDPSTDFSQPPKRRRGRPRKDQG